MCLGIPGKVLSVEGTRGTVAFGNVKRTIDFSLLEQVKPGEYVLVHAGFAINKIDEQEAEETLKLISEMLEAAEEQ